MSTLFLLSILLRLRPHHNIEGLISKEMSSVLVVCVSTYLLLLFTFQCTVYSTAHGIRQTVHTAHTSDGI
jgi:hypothetical protein